MLHTVYLDDTTTNGKKLLKELRRYKKGVHFDAASANTTITKEYMTIEEFRTEAKASLTKILNEHGIH
ncbi:MAG: hypothetical protein LBT48_01025 [Prevotellaceae bacterium]|jgi:hypothetical protein|nr:hypothetical protein [Prevotellaceae bacterium]